MQIRTIRRIVADANHNAFTGAAFFQRNLYVAYRQGDSHVCQEGKIIVLRSRNDGLSFDHAAVLRGQFDTRDAQLFTTDERLYAVGFEADAAEQFVVSGCSWTQNGLNWSPWTRYQGVDNWCLWRPRWHQGRFYCPAYGQWREPNHSALAWYESDDGIHWQQKLMLRSGPDKPSEAFLQFKADGQAVMLVRRDAPGAKPLLMTAKPPYREWETIELDVALTAPALWLNGQEIWIAGRWFPHEQAAHVGIFRLDGAKAQLQAVLPSGPGFDCSYVGVAAHPLNPRSIFLSYYSGHEAPADPSLSQWDHPDIYLAELVYEADFIQNWKASILFPGRSLAAASLPDAADASFKWQAVRAGANPGEANFVNLCHLIQNRPGVIYLTTDLEVGPTDAGVIHLGYDGPVRAWLNDELIFEGLGKNPALADKTSVAVKFRHGSNRLTIALDTNAGKAWGIYGRYDSKS